MTSQEANSGRPSDEPVKRRRSALARIWRPVQWVVNLLVLAAAVLVFTPLGSWYGRELVVLDDLAKSDYIVVLGGDYERAVEGARLFRDGWAKKLIATSTADDAPGLAAVAVRCGVPKEAVLIDGDALRTQSHPRTIARVAPVRPREDRILVVTSLYHSSRAKACFERAGYRHVTMRVPRWHLAQRKPPLEENSVTRARDLPLKTYEYLAWAYYKLRGWL